MRQLERVLVCAFLSVLLPGAAHGQVVNTIDVALGQRIDRIAVQVLEETGVPSASVAVVKGGKLVYAHAYGKARLEPANAATPEMRYSIGSI
jgi:CubicO group peptidase (beta-lactamase class C family)